MGLEKLNDSQLERKVFIYPTSVSDKRFFKQRIVDFIRDNTPGKSFTQWMYNAVHERNNNGETLKYAVYSEKLQRVFLNKYFYGWMKRNLEKAEKELKLLQEFQ